jgi:hypothetical protein
MFWITPDRGNRVSMMLRYVRAIILLVCIAAACKLVALWVRSYRFADQWPGPIWRNSTYLVASKQGCLTALLLRPHGAPGWWLRQYRSVPVGDELSFPGGDMRYYKSTIGFGWIRNPHYSVMRSTQTLPDGSTIMLLGAASATLRGGGPVIPYWFLVSLVALFGSLSFLQWPPRFSIRGLLIAITIVSMILALASILDRSYFDVSTAGPTW